MVNTLHYGRVQPLAATRLLVCSENNLELFFVISARYRRRDRQSTFKRRAKSKEDRDEVMEVEKFKLKVNPEMAGRSAAQSPQGQEKSRGERCSRCEGYAGLDRAGQTLA